MPVSRIYLCFAIFFCPLLFSQTILEITSPNPAEDGLFGVGLSGISDLNGDGYDDILIGAPGERNGFFEAGGLAYVFSGVDQGLILSIKSLFPESYAYFGADVEEVGDWDNDGLTEVIIGTPWEDGGGEDGGGRAYVFSKPNPTPIHLFFSDSSTNNGLFGLSVASGHDLNNDGYNEVLIGARNEGPMPTRKYGRVHLFNGATRSLIHMIIPPDSLFSTLGFGSSVNFINDINNDQVSDILIGASSSNSGGVSASGKAYIYSGSDFSHIHTFFTPSPQKFGNFGGNIKPAGDIDGDGIDDIAIYSAEAVPQYQTKGKIHLYSGATLAPIYTIIPPASDSAFAISSSFVGIGDYDVDGHDDLLIGQVQAEVNGIGEAGKVHIVSGQTGSYVASYQSPNPEEAGFFGRSVALLDDVNDDALPEFLVSSNETANGVDHSGRVYIILSGTTSIDNGNARTVPTDFTLEQNFPNPFNPSTTIPVQLAIAQQLELNIYNTAGQQIRRLATGYYSAGSHEFVWDGQNDGGRPVGSGIYFFELSSGSDTKTLKMILMR